MFFLKFKLQFQCHQNTFHFLLKIFFLFQEDPSGLRHIEPKTKELKYNPKHDELFAPYVSDVSVYRSYNYIYCHSLSLHLIISLEYFKEV